MKLLVLLVVILGAVWLWQRGRRAPKAAGHKKAARQAVPMVRCRRCGVHLPGSDAVAGREGSYCSTAHRRESEGA